MMCLKAENVCLFVAVKKQANERGKETILGQPSMSILGGQWNSCSSLPAMGRLWCGRAKQHYSQTTQSWQQGREGR